MGSGPFYRKFVLTLYSLKYLRMKRTSLLILSAIIVLLFSGCPYGYRYNTGKFPADPVNLSSINSMYDDYNMSSPVIEGNRYLYFSSNRESFGENFDVVGSNVHISWDKDKGQLTVDNKKDNWKDMHYVDTLFSMLNSQADEYGPYSLPYYTYGTTTDFTDLVIYATNAGGNLDLNFVYFTGPGDNPGVDVGEFYGPYDVYPLNSIANDAYISFYGPGFIQFLYGTEPSYISEVYLCSDRGGNFDIYFEKIPYGVEILDFLLMESTLEVQPVEVLNSSSQDKCPYIDGNLMVFASDRAGGFGGYDLYYSQRQGSSWSEPVNFGNRVNTEYDEYRPIVMMFYEFEHDLMLFSSNRPGGKGGYDLYYVGIPPMIN